MLRSIPADFPRESAMASLARLQPKLAGRLDETTGNFVGALTDAEAEARYDMCADLVTQLLAKCKVNRDTKYRELSEVQILERLFAQLVATGWGTEAEMKWVVRQTASALGWVIPESATLLRVLLGY